jgi:DNA polymerase V
LITTPVSAGFPSPAADDLEDEIDPIAWVIRHPTSTFWWRVEGNCLWDVGIRDGDLIAVDRAGKRRIGRAVLAVVKGAVTAKILRKRDNRFFLAPANSQEHFLTLS